MRQFQPPKGLHIRPSTPADKPFLEKLHRSVREDLQWISGDRELVESIIEMQFVAQTQGYGSQFPNALYFIIEKHHQPIGKATVDFGVNEVRLVDIAFVPEARGHGFGPAIIQSFQTAAAQTGAPMTLTVDSHNVSAKNVYLQLGFQTESVTPPYEFMVWYPPALAVSVGV
jgi:ribosomal protein S18 acetylase RimI-like enzyme